MKTISVSLLHKALLAVVLLLLPILITFLHGYRNNREFLKRHILFTSGYGADITKVRGAFGPETDFIRKPAPPAEFLKKIREVLDR